MISYAPRTGGSDESQPGMDNANAGKKVIKTETEKDKDDTKGEGLQAFDKHEQETMATPQQIDAIQKIVSSSNLLIRNMDAWLGSLTEREATAWIASRGDSAKTKGSTKTTAVPSKHTTGGRETSQEISEAQSVIAGGKISWTPEQIQLIRDMTAPQATWNEFKVYLYQAAKMGLDPLQHQIWLVKYSQTDPASIFAGFNGFLAKVAESKDYDGFDTTDPDKIAWVDDAEQREPKYIDCTFYRKGVAHPVTFRAFLKDFKRYSVQGLPTKAWASMPYIMLRKCAIANAARQMFPEVVGSLYISEEMPQDEKPERDEKA